MELYTNLYKILLFYENIYSLYILLGIEIKLLNLIDRKIDI